MSMYHLQCKGALVALLVLVVAISCASEAGKEEGSSEQLKEALRVLPAGAKALEVIPDGRGQPLWVLWRYKSRCYLSPVYNSRVQGMAEAHCPFSI